MKLAYNELNNNSNNNEFNNYNNELNNYNNEFNIIEQINKIQKYYYNLYNLSISYLEELKNNLEDKKNIDIIEFLLKNNNFIKIQKKLSLDSKYILTNDDLYIIYDNIKLLLEEINNFMNLINKYNIFEEKTLLSDTSKNNINQNKLSLLDIYSKVNNKYNIFNQKYINYVIINFKYTYDNYIKLFNYYSKNNKIIDLYINIVNKYLSLDSIHFKDYIKFQNNQIQNNIINNELINNKYKFNINKLEDINYLFKNNISIIKKNNNIINKFNQYIIYKSFTDLNKLFLEIYNTEYKFKNNKLDNNTLKYINQILIDYYKIEKKYINIIILESSLDNINYNSINLLDQNFKLEKNQGINLNYILKTKTIYTKKEIESNNTDEEKNIKNDIYINNINNIYNINNYNYKKTDDKLNLLLHTDFILLFKLDNTYHIMQYYNDNNIYMKYENIQCILNNKPKYYIENYNSLIERSLLKNIENNNMLELYQNKIENDFKNLAKIDNLELKNILINKIRKDIKLIKNNKSENIEKILNIINEEIYKYILKINNIDFTFELYMTYFSNMSKLINKIKKELNDNYDDNILNNIDNILDNIYNNILSINNSILDKYYLINI